MALAALGDPARFRSLFAQAIPHHPDRVRPRPVAVPAAGPPLGLRRASRPRSPPRPARRAPPARRRPSVHADLAAALQERTEEVMLHLARRARALTGSRRLCLGGGVATNCVGVGRIIERGPLRRGVRAARARRRRHRDRRRHRRAPATRPAGVLAGVTAAVLPRPRLPGFSPRPGPGPACRADRSPDPAAEFLADQLAEGTIVGLFQGRLEAGPRALGNRSILASPLRPASSSG